MYCYGMFSTVVANAVLSSFYDSQWSDSKLSETTNRQTCVASKHSLPFRRQRLLESCAGWNFLSAPALHPQEFEKSCPLPPRRFLTHPAMFPSQTCTCHRKPLKTHVTCFIASGNLCSGSFQNQRKSLKNILNKKAKPSFLLMSLSHALSQHSVACTKSFFIPRPLRTHISTGFRTRLATAGTRNPRGLIRPAQEPNAYAQISRVGKQQPFTSLRWKTVQHRILRKRGSLKQSTTTERTLVCPQAVICLPHKKPGSECYVIERFIRTIAQRPDYYALLM